MILPLVQDAAYGTSVVLDVRYYHFFAVRASQGRACLSRVHDQYLPDVGHGSYFRGSVGEIVPVTRIVGW
jgi:hypothetical protein